MATAFLQVADNVKLLAPNNSFNNTTSPLTISGVNTSILPAVTNGYALTIWDDKLYSDPGDDPNMEKCLVTAAVIGASGSFTVTRPFAKAHIGSPRVALLGIAQHISDLDTAVNNAENNIATNSSAISSKVTDLTDILVPTAGQLQVGKNSGVTVTGTFTAPTPDATVTTPPQRFAITNRNTSGTTTLQFPNYVGTTINLTVLPGEVITFRQVTTSGYINESGNKPLAQLDLRYDPNGAASSESTRAQGAEATLTSSVAAKYTKPASGIPATDLTSSLQTTISGSEQTANKGIANGYAGLDSAGKLPTSLLPQLAISDTFVVASQSAMLALTAQRGDTAKRTDTGQVYILAADDPTVLANWTLLSADFSAAVDSVNGRSGAVTGLAEDSAVFHKTGNESASGTKTFNNPLIIQGTTNAWTTSSDGAAISNAGANDTYWKSQNNMYWQPNNGSSNQVSLVNGKLLVNSDPVSNLGVATKQYVDNATSSGVINRLRVFDVNDYGAIGNGSTDDLSAIQSAANAINAAGGGILQFRNATYLISDQVQLKSNTIVQGSGSTVVTGNFTNDSYGLFCISSQNNIAIKNIKFNIVSGKATAIRSLGHVNLAIKDCEFISNASNFGGIIFLDGGSANSIFKRTVIENCYIHDSAIGNSGRCITLYPRSTNYIYDVVIDKNRFENITGTCINLDPGAGSRLYNLSVSNNQFAEILGASGITAPGVAVYGSTSSNYQIDGISIKGNIYKNSLNTTTQSQGFVYLYGAKNIVVSDNIGYGAWTQTNNIVGPWFAPGRTNYPLVNLTVTNNVIKGFDNAIDPDSMRNVIISGNTVENCFGSFTFGYNTQENIRIENNVMRNCSAGGIYTAQILFGNSNPIKCTFKNNTLIDDRNVPAPTNVTAALSSGGTLTPGTQVYYVITSLDDVGETIASNQVTVTPTAGNQNAVISWTRVYGATNGYKIYRSTNSGSYGTTSLIGTVLTGSQTNYTFTDSGVAATNGSPPSNSSVATTTTNAAIELTGNYNFADIEVSGNRFFLPNATFSNGFFRKELGNEILPITVIQNEYQDSTGRYFYGVATPELPDVTVNTAGSLLAGVGSNVTASGTYVAPIPATNLTTPPQRFRIINRTTANVTLQFPNPIGTTITLTVLSGEVITFRQVTTNGYTAESGNKGLAQLDARYGQLATNNTWALTQTFSVSPQVPTATTGDNTLNAASTAFVSSAIANAVTGALTFKGSTDASTNPNYPSAKKGDVYVVTVAGKIGGASGPNVEIGDEYFATADNAGGSQATVGTNWTILQANLDGALLSANNLSDVANASTARTNLGSAKSGSNNDITALTGLTTPLAITEGGTASASQTTNGILFYNGTALTSGTSLVWNGTTLGVNQSNPTLGRLQVTGASGSVYISTNGDALFGTSGIFYINGQGGNLRIQTAGSDRVNINSGGAYFGGGNNATSTLQSGGSFARAYVAKTAAYTATASDDIIDCTSGTFTVTLPTAASIAGREYNIKNSGTGTITLATTSSQTIDGATTKTLAQYNSYNVVSNGANWIVI